MPRRMALAHLPTPLIRLAATGKRLGLDLWMKRDDATGGAEAGNKIRKLEYLLADAVDAGADTIITCGGIQSNHARATAIAAAQLGLSSVLLLRDPLLADDGDGAGVAPTAWVGNLLLGRMVGADVRRITLDSYRRRATLMERVADDLRARGNQPYVIVEGGSNGLGSLGYVDAMGEVREQLGDEAGFDVIVVACGSGGSAAGIALGAGHHQVAAEVRAVAVCNDRAFFEGRITSIIDEMRQLDPHLGNPTPWLVEDSFKGPGYGVSTLAQLESMGRLAREAGVLLDPVYGGKAFHALEELARATTPRANRLAGRRVLFVHTGGLPGLLAEPEVFAAELSRSVDPA